MRTGTGLMDFSKQYRDRFFDVGIAEEHAVVFAEGLSKGGMIPFFVVYSTFLQRCYDQLIHDAALQKQMLDQTVKMNERFMTQMSSDRGHPVSAADADLQRRNLELQAKLNALEIENRLRAERAAEDEKRRAAEAAKPKPAAPGMTQEEQAAKIRQFKQAAAAIHEREEALRKKEESLKAREAKAAAEEASLKQRATQLHRQALYPEYFDEEGNEMPQPVRRRPAAAPQPAPTARPAARPAPRPAAAKPAAPAPAPAPAANTERDDIDELDDILPPLESETAPATPETAPAPAPTPKPVAVKPAAKQNRERFR